MTVRRLLFCSAIAVAAAVGGCNTPTEPTPTPVTPSPVTPNPVINAPPTLGVVRVQGLRSNEPPNFADVGEEVDVSVTVTDAESPVSALKFTWSAPTGAFSGTGAAVKWRAPATATTPASVILSVEIVETYTSQGRSLENKVTGTAAVMLHNSVQEVSDLSRQFLLDFSNSNLPVDYVMRNFSPSCKGTADETSDVTKNRNDFVIISFNVGAAVTTVNFGGICPFRRKEGDACSRVPVQWRSRARLDLFDASGKLVLRAGQDDEAIGVDQLAAVYDRLQRSWKLCDSSWDRGANSLTIKSLVP